MRKLIEKMEYDLLTGLPMVEDIRGNLHILNQENAINCHNLPRVYLQTDLKDGTWGTSSNFNRIPDSLHAGNFLVYTVPIGYVYNLAFVIAAAFSRGKDDGISVLALYVNDAYSLGVPFYREFPYKLYTPIPYSEGTKLEFKFKPAIKSMDFGMVAGGHLIQKGN